MAPPNPQENDGAKERFAHLHYSAARVRLDVLARILSAIEQRGGIEAAPVDLLEEAVAAAADVTDNLRWSYERIARIRQDRPDIADSDIVAPSPAARAIDGFSVRPSSDDLAAPTDLFEPEKRRG